MLRGQIPAFSLDCSWCLDDWVFQQRRRKHLFFLFVLYVVEDQGFWCRHQNHGPSQMHMDNVLPTHVWFTEGGVVCHIRSLMISKPSLISLKIESSGGTRHRYYKHLVSGHLLVLETHIAIALSLRSTMKHTLTSGSAKNIISESKTRIKQVYLH